MSVNAFIKSIEKSGIAFKKDLPMKEHTSFRIGGNADAAVFPHSREQLADILTVAGDVGIPTFVVGKGSNLLVSDEGYRGVMFLPKVWIE